MKLKLKGQIISDDWAEMYRYFGYDTGFFCPNDISAAIDALEPGEELELQVNSVGGDVDAAAEIYSALLDCSNPTRAVIQSLAASAASYMILACDTVDIAAPAQMMIHLSSWYCGGNQHDHDWAAAQLKAQDKSILDTYVVKCGEEHREELSQLMDAESFLPAEDCLRLGLVDSILIPAADEPAAPLNMVAAVHHNLITAMDMLPDIRDLIARKEDINNKAKAQLDLEKNRF